VPSVPPPDNCAGYLGAATSTTEVGLIRIPHVAKWFDTSNLTANTLFEQEETTYFSVTQYGSADGTYQPGSPQSGSLGNQELLVDASGSNVFVRMKGASPSYQGGYAPTSERAGVPCYFDDNPTAKRWHEVTGDTYVASAKNIGSGAPQGVNCSVSELVDDSCLQQLKSHIKSTGGSYQA
jgi:hypothetical protein